MDTRDAIDVGLHIRSGDIPQEHFPKVHELRELLAFECKEYRENEHIQHFCTNTILHHFLIARKYNLEKSYKLLCTALEWRAKRNPNQWFRSNMPPQEMNGHEYEARTGKIQLCGRDRFDREIIVFDNSVQNTTGADGQLNFLAWNLELAIHTMPDHVDKYVVFMHLGNFSIFNSPPLQTTKETILMLTSCYPERLGHCICYNPPSYFFHIFNMMKALGLIDKRTLKKVLFILGDVSDGSENDILLSSIIGSNWKALTNATSEVLSSGCSPGFVHDEYWPWLMQRWEQVNFRLFENEAFDSTKLDRLSTKVNADGAERDAAEIKQNQPLDNKMHIYKQNGDEDYLIRSFLRLLRYVMRPAARGLSNVYRALLELIEWADEMGNKPIYGTITTYVAFGFLLLVAVIGFVVKTFYSTIMGCMQFILDMFYWCTSFVRCMIDLTGSCQIEFFVSFVVPCVRISIKLIPYIVTPLVFLVMLQIFMEQSHEASSIVEGIEGALERSSRKARVAMRRLSKQTNDLGKQLSSSDSLRILSSPSSESQEGNQGEEEEEEEEDNDDFDEDNIVLYEGKLLRGKAALNARITVAHRKTLKEISDQIKSPNRNSDKSADKSHGSRFQTPSKSISKSNLYTASPKSGNLNDKFGTMNHTRGSLRKSLSTPVSSRSLSAIEIVGNEDKRPPVTTSAPVSLKRTPVRPSYSNLPPEDRPMALDMDMEDDF